MLSTQKFPLQTTLERYGCLSVAQRPYLDNNTPSGHTVTQEWTLEPIFHFRSRRSIILHSFHSLVDASTSTSFAAQQHPSYQMLDPLLPFSHKMVVTNHNQATLIACWNK
jgi:hypothetical protein